MTAEFISGNILVVDIIAGRVILVFIDSID